MDDEKLYSNIQNAIKNNNIFIAGDYNFIFPGEHDILPHVELHDLWLLRNSHENGCTWDTQNNTFLNL